MPVLHITKDTFDTEVMNSPIPTLVDFFATWCGPCQMLGPVLEEIAAERPDVKICKIDVDAEKELARKFRVMSVPTILLIKNGEIVHRSSGAMEKDEVLALL